MSGQRAAHPSWRPLQELPDAVVEAVLEQSSSRPLEETRRLTDLVGAIAGTLAPVRPPSPALRDRLLGAVTAADQRFAPFWSRLGAMFDLPEPEVRAVLMRAGDDAGWDASPLPGVDLLHFTPGPAYRGRRVDAGLVRVAPNTPFPDHEHLGDEHVLILAGAYADSSGTEYGPGDVHLMPRGSVHHYVAGAGGVTFAVLLADGITIPGVGDILAPLVGEPGPG